VNIDIGLVRRCIELRRAGQYADHRMWLLYMRTYDRLREIRVSRGEVVA